MAINRLPNFLYRYFWDCEPNQLDPNKKKTYIAERILEYGDPQAFRWLNKHFKKSTIKKIILKSKTLGKKSANYYSIYYQIPANKILCLQEEFRRKHRKIWNF